MIAPLTTEQQNAVHALQCRARARGVPCELHFDANWRVIIVLGTREFASIADASAHMSGLELAA